MFRINCLFIPNDSVTSVIYTDIYCVSERGLFMIVKNIYQKYHNISGTSVRQYLLALMSTACVCFPLTKTQTVCHMATCKPSNIMVCTIRCLYFG